METRRLGGDDLDAYVAVWNAITPEDPASAEQQRERLARDPRRLHLLVEEGGRAIACGFAGPSDTPGRGFLTPRVLPEARRRGIGVGLLRELARHLQEEGFETASAHVDGNDGGSLAFAARHGFEETDRQVEQVRVLGAETPVEPPAGVTFATVADRPELLREAFDLAQEGYADLVLSSPVAVSLDDWLEDEATYPAGSFVALADGEIVGYSGLCRQSEEGVAEDGLTVVRRSWRRRGLALALKRAELAWAAANGIREIVTWTQRGNAGMRTLNERLGYSYRGMTVTVRAPLPLP